jgi:hypothetical protein
VGTRACGLLFGSEVLVFVDTRRHGVLMVVFCLFSVGDGGMFGTCMQLL